MKIFKNQSFCTIISLIAQSIRKVLTHTLMEEDWYIDPQPGVLIFEFERPSKFGSYQMLHLVMDVKRKNPSRENRAPGDDSLEALEAYKQVVHQIFSEKEIIVTESSINKTKLRKSLENIKGRRKKYYPDEEEFVYDSRSDKE